jgi:hypothetical protein
MSGGWWCKIEGKDDESPVGRELLPLMRRHYSSSPSGRGRGEGQRAVGRVLACVILPYAEVKTAIGGCDKTGPVCWYVPS